MNRERWAKLKRFFDVQTIGDCAYCKDEIDDDDEPFYIEVDGQELVYCDEECYGDFIGKRHAKDVPDELVDEIVSKIHQGQCMICEGHGPVDLVKTHYIFSLLIVSFYDCSEYTCCGRCVAHHWGLPQQDFIHHCMAYTLSA